MPASLRCRIAALASLAVLAASGVGSTLQAQPAMRCDRARRIVAIDFSGSPRFSDDTLAAAIVTRPPSLTTRLFGRGELPCADSLEVLRDALRIAVLHRRAGWFTAAVTPRYEPTGRGTRLVFDIVPGPPATLDTLVISGLPDPPPGRRGFEATLRDLEDELFDRARLNNTIEQVLGRLRDVGFARAQRPSNTISIDTAAALARVTLAFEPGTRAFLGQVRVAVQGIGDDPPRLDSAAVMRLVRLRPGDRYSASALVDAQRDLYRSEAFRLVLIDTAERRAGMPDSIIDLRISVAEARTRYARPGIGWATQDCMRAQARLADRSFLGVGRRAELNLRASKIGVGEPADFARALCSNSVRNDPYSVRLNYYAGVSLSDTRLFGTPIVPVLSVYSERRSEPYAYLRETSIGSLLELTQQLSPRTVGTAGVQYENGRTVTDPVTSCSRLAQCRPEDYEVSLFGRGVGIASTALTHDRTNNTVNPSRGQRLRGELRAGQTFSERDGSLRFYRTTGEGAVFVPFFGGVIASRLQLSRAFAPGSRLADGTALLPAQERLFAGGQNSVRGFQQNLLGPLVYVIDSDSVQTVTRPDGAQVIETLPNVGYVRALPRGGTALLVANLEYRRTVPAISQQLQFAAFVDVGNVWETTSGGFRREDLRATPGIGLRLATPLGPFRVDLGYSPYPPRAGRALYLTEGANGQPGTIRCASPGNNVFIDRDATPGAFDCPDTYQPPRGRTVLSRLAFHFGLGQAF